jgi:hypothetical protein
MTQIVIDIPASLATLIPSAQQIALALVCLAATACAWAVLGVIGAVCSAIDKRFPSKPLPPLHKPVLVTRVSPIVASMIILGTPLLLVIGASVLTFFQSH